MRIFLLTLILFIPSLFFSQLSESLINQIEPNYYFDEYEGSIYIHSRYKDASIIDEKSGTFDAKLKYNVYTDAFDYRKNSNLYEIEKDPTIHIRIDDNYYYYCNFSTQREQSRNGYYMLVELQDKYRIYKKYTLDIKEPKKVSGSTAYGLELGSIQLVATYYLEENDIIMELSLDEKEILETFKDKSNELMTYLKKEKIKLKKEPDLVRFVSKYNALKNIDSTHNRSLLSNISED